MSIIEVVSSLLDSQDLNSGEDQALEYYKKMGTLREGHPAMPMTNSDAGSSARRDSAAVSDVTPDVAKSTVSSLVRAVSVLPLPIIPSGSPYLKWPMGADLAFLVALSHLESTCNPAAQSQSSSASGLLQLTADFRQDMNVRFSGCLKYFMAAAREIRLSGAIHACDDGVIQQALLTILFLRANLKFDEGGVAIGLLKAPSDAKEQPIRYPDIITSEAYSQIFDDDESLHNLSLGHRRSFVMAILYDHIFHFGVSASKDISVTRARALVFTMCEVMDILEGRTPIKRMLRSSISDVMVSNREDIWDALRHRRYFDWMWQISKYPVSSTFGSRIHPISKVEANHNGVDVVCPVGTVIGPVFGAISMVQGRDDRSGQWARVRFSPESAVPNISSSRASAVRHWGFSLGLWPYVLMRTLPDPMSATFELVFAHLSEAPSLDPSSLSVRVVTGNSGASTGPHLHIGVKINGVFVDPDKYLWLGNRFKGGSASLAELESSIEQLLRVALV